MFLIRILAYSKNFTMSQAVFTYTLPNGTQVLIPTLDSKSGEIFPLLLLGDRSAEPPILDASSSTGVFFSEMQVGCNDLDPAVNTSCSSDANVIQDNLGTDNLDPSFSNDMKCMEKQDVYGSAVVNSELSDLIELHRTENNIKNTEIEVKNYDNLRLSKSPEDLHNLEDSSLNVTKNVTVDSCDQVVSFHSILETCRTAGIAIKNPTSETQLGLDVQVCDKDTCDNEQEDNLVLKPNAKELNINEEADDDINMSDYVDIRNKNSTEEILQLASTVANDSNSVLKQVCPNVALCLDHDVKNDELAACNNSILDHLDEFAEMVTWFKCRLCKFAAGNKSELLDHLRKKHLEGHYDGNPASKFGTQTHHPKRQDTVSEKLVFLCGQCSAVFSSISACKTHMMEDHDMIVQEHETENSGSTCTEESGARATRATRTTKASRATSSGGQGRAPRSNSKDYCPSQKHSANAALFKCSVRWCQCKFNEEKDLHIHMGCHPGTDDRDFRCCECQTPFERWRTCAMHLWKVHNIDCGLLTCPVCLKYKTATSVPLENHMRIHGESRSFTCPECGKGFKQSAQLHNHRVMHLDRKTSELPKWYASKQCNICFKNYANSKCLKKHIQAVHSKLRPYVCQVCGHASARKAMLQLHYRQHTGEKPHTCPLCDYRTGDHNSLRRHIMRHTGQRPYRCPHCPYSAIQSNSYKNHLRNKHPGQSGVFSCGQCSYKTVSNEGYLLHVSDHKNGLITSSSDGNGSDVEVFPGNVAAAQLIYRCLNALSSDGTTVEANVTGSSTSADGTMQTITIQIPNQECSSENEDEVTRCFLEVQQHLEEENGNSNTVTIPSVSDQSSFCQLVT